MSLRPTGGGGVGGLARWGRTLVTVTGVVWGFMSGNGAGLGWGRGGEWRGWGEGEGEGFGIGAIMVVVLCRVGRGFSPLDYHADGRKKWRFSCWECS